MASTRNVSLDLSLAIDHGWPAPGTFHGKLLALHFSGIGCISVRDSSFKKLLIFYITSACPVASSLALALAAVEPALPAVLQQQQLVTSPHAAYHPRASSCFFSSRLQHFHCSASQLQRRQHTHSDSRAATFRDRKRTDVPTRPLTRTIVQNNTRAMLL